MIVNFDFYLIKLDKKDVVYKRLNTLIDNVVPELDKLNKSYEFVKMYNDKKREFHMYDTKYKEYNIYLLKKTFKNNLTYFIWHLSNTLNPSTKKLKCFLLLLSKLLFPKSNAKFI